MIRKESWVDFKSWKIEAENKEQAHAYVIQRLKAGEIPQVTHIESSDIGPLLLIDQLYEGVVDGS